MRGLTWITKCNIIETIDNINEYINVILVKIILHTTYS